MDWFNLENICGICMEESRNLCNTKETTVICNNEDYLLLDVINSFLDNELFNIAITICIKCKENATQAYNFILQCNNLQRTFMQLYQKQEPSENQELIDIQLYRNHEPNEKQQFIKSTIEFEDVQIKEEIVDCDTTKIDLLCHRKEDRRNSDETNVKTTVPEKSFTNDSSSNNETVLRIESNQENDKPVTNLKLLKCNLCPESFITNRALFNHKSTHGSKGMKNKQKPQPSNDNKVTTTELELFSCECCTKSFTNKCALLRHVKRHDYRRKYRRQYLRRSGIYLESLVQQKLVSKF